MELSKAKQIAGHIVNELSPFCDRVEVVGEIRREIGSIANIQILVAPKGALLFDFMLALSKLGCSSMKVEAKKSFNVNGANVEVWLTTEDRWPVMLLIRTGGEESNRDLAKLCEKGGYHLSVSKGQILKQDGSKAKIFDDETWEERDIQSEKDVYKLLGIKYKEPKERK